jgi:hypothetical protein
MYPIILGLAFKMRVTFFYILYFLCCNIYAQDISKNQIELKFNFEKDHGNWEVYNSEKSASYFSKSKYIIESFINRGTIRTIENQISGVNYEIKAHIQIKKNFGSTRYGIVYGFLDFNNYHFFAVTGQKYYIGYVKDGVVTYSSFGLEIKEAIVDNEYTFTITTDYSLVYFKLNDEVIASSERTKLVGNKIGYLIEGIGKLKSKFFQIMQDGVSNSENPKESFSKYLSNGMLLEDGKSILCPYDEKFLKYPIVIGRTSKDGNTKYSKANFVKRDGVSDLCLLNISDTSDFNNDRHSFEKNISLNYKIGEQIKIVQLKSENYFRNFKIENYMQTILEQYGAGKNSLFFKTDADMHNVLNGALVYNSNNELIGMISLKRNEFVGACEVIKSILIDGFLYELNISNLREFTANRIVAIGFYPHY